MPSSIQSSLGPSTFLVTGATSGIGLETARALARRGTVLITGRDERRGEAAARDLASAGGGPVRFLPADHATRAGNLDLAARVAALAPRLDVLVNNAGALVSDRQLTTEGDELMLAVNVLAPAILTRALLPALRRASAPRVVTVTSSSHTLWTRDPLDDLAEGATSSGLARYGQTKLAATLWVSGFARRAEVSKVALYATNPGMAWTGMTTAISTATVPWWLAPLWPFFRLVQRRASPAAAARSSVLLAPAPGLERLTGGYFEKDGRPANNGVLRRWLPSAERMVQFVDALAAAPTPRNVSRAHPPG